MIIPSWLEPPTWLPLRRARCHSILRHLLGAVLVVVSLALLTGCAGATTGPSTFVFRRQPLPLLTAPHISLLSGYRAINQNSFLQVSSLSSYSDTQSALSGLQSQQRIMFALGQEDYHQIYDSGLDGRSRRLITLTQQCLGQLTLAFQQTAILCRSEQGILLMPLPAPQTSQSPQRVSQITPPQRYVFQQYWGANGGGVAWDQSHHRIATLANVQGSCQLAIYSLSSLTAQAYLLATYDLAQIIAHVGGEECPVYDAAWAADGDSLLINVGASLTTEEVVQLKLPLIGSPAPAPLQPFPLDQTRFGPTSRFGASASWFPSSATEPSSTFAYVAPDGRSILTDNVATGQTTTVFALSSAQVTEGRLCAVAWVPTGSSLLFGLCGKYFGFQEDVYIYTLAASQYI